MDLPAHWRAAITGRMRQLHLSQQDLASLLEIDQTTLSAKLAGRRPFLESEVAQIAGILEMEDLQQDYPEHVSEDMRQRRYVTLALRVMQKSFEALPSHDLQEVLFGLALILEGKRKAGAPGATLLRGLSHVASRKTFATV